MCLYRYTKVLSLLIIGRNFIKCVMPFDKLSCTIWNISNIWLDTRVYLHAQLIVCCISFLYSSEYCFITFLSCGWLFIYCSIDWLSQKLVVNERVNYLITGKTSAYFHPMSSWRERPLIGQSVASDFLLSDVLIPQPPPLSTSNQKGLTLIWIIVGISIDQMTTWSTFDLNPRTHSGTTIFFPWNCVEGVVAVIWNGPLLNVMAFKGHLIRLRLSSSITWPALRLGRSQ